MADLKIPRDVWEESAKRTCKPENKGPITWTLSNVMREFDAIPDLDEKAYDAVRNAITRVIAIYDRHAKDSRHASAATGQVPEQWREFVERVAKQTPEKPDYWSSCGQCERNTSDAEDLLEVERASKGESNHG